jgi:CDP-glucose 4,6-dehydratase
MFADCYRNKKVFVTGHTGFKGSWLCLWLMQLSAKVYGYALAPTEHSHYSQLALPMSSQLADIRDLSSLVVALRTASPEIVFHLAAQPLVLESYRDPVTTWHTNVMGTVNLLEACRQVPSVKAVVVITTDKCYQNQEWPWPYRESDTLGGHDPYSASKAAAELVVSSYRTSFSQDAFPPLLIATARAGNVIGGGDWAQDRLVPDAVRAVQVGRPVEIRNPKAVRPWQHVLEPLSAYLLIGQRLLAGDERAAKAWNVGPSERDVASVAEVLDELGRHWPALQWLGTTAHAHETQALRLDSSLISAELGWNAVWPLSRALAETAAWYQRGDSAHLHSLPQLRAYIADAAAANVGWAI